MLDYYSSTNLISIFNEYRDEISGLEKIISTNGLKENLILIHLT